MLVDDSGGGGVVVNSSSPTPSLTYLQRADDNPYEALPSSAKNVTHMMAGAAAGILEHTVMYPIDCIKV